MCSEPSGINYWDAASPAAPLPATAAVPRGLSLDSCGFGKDATAAPWPYRAALRGIYIYSSPSIIPLTIQLPPTMPQAS